MNALNEFLPTKQAFEVSETDNCKLPAHAIWALRLGRWASISQNTAGVWPTYHAASAASLQLTKAFDNLPALEMQRECDLGCFLSRYQKDDS